MNRDSKSPDPLAWMGQAYSIKRHGVTLTNCDSEPVRTPGCIQAHGALLVVRIGDLTVLQASENTLAILGRGPEDLLGAPLREAVGVEVEARINDFLTREPTHLNPLLVDSIPKAGGAGMLNVIVHTIDGLGLVEFEPRVAPETQPDVDYYAFVKKTVGKFQTAQTLRHFCTMATEGFRELTGLDRVMVYKFHADGHGEVFAESHRAGLSSWLGLHYPADDIPRPAREVFTKVWIRPFPDVNVELAEMVPLVNPDTRRPLDMTYCSLRGASVMYTEYLRNMGVVGSITMAIRRGETLWGLIAGHHYGTPMPISFEVRAACELLAQVISLQHNAAEDRENFAYRLRLETTHQELIANSSHEGLAALTGGELTLLDGIEAGGAAVLHRDRWWRVGKTPTEHEIDGLCLWLAKRPEFDSITRPVFATDALAKDYPPASSFASTASGVLAVALSRNFRNLILWFRPETLRTVNWGGNPDEKPLVPGPNGPRLTPRRSFELFKQSVHERSLPWKEVEIDAAARLRMLAMELVVTRVERLAELNSDLMRSNEELDSFAYVASHDLKEPLRGIHKYAYQLLESVQEGNEEDARKLEGLIRLTLRMDSLLDSLLHCSRIGRSVITIEDVDVDEVLHEAVEMVGGRIDEDSFACRIPRQLPTIRCDRVHLREIFVNLLSNAIKYNDKPRKLVEVGYITPSEYRQHAEIPDRVRGVKVYYVRDNGIGIVDRHKKTIFTMFKRLHARDEYGGGTGVGLTIVKKLVEQHRGHIWLESEPGQGSTFYFSLAREEGELK